MEFGFYSTKIQSVGLRKRPCYHNPSEKVYVTIANISQSLLHIMTGKQPAWNEEIASLSPYV